MPENESSVTLSGEETSGTAPGGANGTVDPETIQEIISLSVGSYVVVEFLIGTQNIVRKEGVLTAVGVSWLLLYDETTGTSVVCDMYSVKFVTYFDPGRRPTDTGSLQSTQQQINAQNQARSRNNRGRW